MPLACGFSVVLHHAVLLLCRVIRARRREENSLLGIAADVRPLLAHACRLLRIAGYQLQLLQALSLARSLYGHHILRFNTAILRYCDRAERENNDSMEKSLWLVMDHAIRKSIDRECALQCMSLLRPACQARHQSFGLVPTDTQNPAGSGQNPPAAASGNNTVSCRLCGVLTYYFLPPLPLPKEIWPKSEIYSHMRG